MRWDPKAYDQQAGFVSDGGRSLIDWLDPQAGERVLDLGCGTGTLGAALAERGAHVIGVDASPEMIATARAAHPGRSFEIGQGQALSFEEEFDAVFSNAALHWMKPPEAVVRGMFRALRGGGRLVAEMGGHGNTATLMAAVDGALDELSAAQVEPVRFARPWYFPRLGEYTALLESAGFEVRGASLFDRPTRVPDQDGRSGVAVWLSMFAADLLAALGPQRQAAFFAAVEGRCRPALFRDGAWWIDYVRLRFMARKPSRR